MRAHFMLWEQFIRPSLKAMRTLVIRPLQGYGMLLPLVTQIPGRGSRTASIYPTMKINVKRFWFNCTVINGLAEDESTNQATVRIH